MTDMTSPSPLASMFFDARMMLSLGSIAYTEKTVIYHVPVPLEGPTHSPTDSLTHSPTDSPPSLPHSRTPSLPSPPLPSLRGIPFLAPASAHHIAKRPVPVPQSATTLPLTTCPSFRKIASLSKNRLDPYRPTTSALATIGLSCRICLAVGSQHRYYTRLHFKTCLQKLFLSLLFIQENRIGR